MVTVIVHPSQFPEAVRGELLKSLRTRKINHKFHYDSIKQVQKWVAVHEAYSPWYNDATCRVIYRRSFEETVAQVHPEIVHVIGLGCGTGKKDLDLLKLLEAKGKDVFYTPCDSSLAMVLSARQTARKVLPAENCYPLVCDLDKAIDLGCVLSHIENAYASRLTQRQKGTRPARLVTFFGMIPNFDPLLAMRRLSHSVQPGDFLLLNVNLVPGSNPVAGMQKIFPQYDNSLTRDWLMTFLLELGIGHAEGKLRFEIGSGQLGIKRVVAKFHFNRTATVRVEHHRFVFKPTDAIQLFYSYRYTPDQLRRLLARHGFTVTGEWVTRSGEEAVFCCVRA